MGRPARKAEPLRQRSLKERAIGLLARREYSRAELRARLVRGGSPPEEVEAVLDQLAGLGYLSDARFAQAVVAQKSGRYGRRAIAHALREKGVESGAAHTALSSLDGVDELAEATALWRRRFGKAPADGRDKARQVRFLLSRGYPMAVAMKVMRAAGAAADELGADLADGE